MWFVKYLTILIYALGLCIVSLYISVIEFTDWFSDIVHEKDSIVNKSYDYIIVGSGSAGSVIAQRLSEVRSNRILVLEAGSYGGKLLDVPMGGPALQRTAADWQYKTVPQSTSCFGLKNKQSRWPMGKIVGGSMYLNNLVYLRGHSRDYKNWFGEAYNYEEDILPYFKRSEKQRGNYRNDTKNHGIDGPLIVDDIPFISEFGKAVIKAAKSLGFPIRDLNADHNTGFMTTQVNLRSGTRFTTAHYLLEQNHPNIHLLTQALAHKILFQRNFEAKAIQFSKFGKTYTISAKKGIVLSAGAIGSPKILLLSGIGPKEHLEEVGIETKINLPVGRNLQDHVTTGVDLILLNQSLDMSMERAISPLSVYDYVFHGKGPLSSPGCEAVGLIDFDGDSVPDLQLMVIPLGIAMDGGVHFRKAMGISDESYRYFSELLQRTTASILPILLHPKSVGYVKLKDRKVSSAPLINPKYLEDASDVEMLLKGVNLIKELLQTEAMEKLGAILNRNVFPGCEDYQFDSKQYWECYIRHLTLTSYHPVGTCKLGRGNDQSRVVETNFKVRGTNKLFVADASVIPSLPSGNINAAVVMVAEKAAETILRQESLSEGSCSIMEVFEMG